MCDREMETGTSREGVQDTGKTKTSTDVVGRDMGIEEGTGKETEVTEMRML